MESKFKTGHEYPFESGVYFWYVTKNGADKLGIDVSKCHVENNMHLIYIGLAKNINERLNWHLNDSHSVSSIRSGFVSTLRQTLSALLVGNMVASKEVVDEFMRNHMAVRYEICKNYKEKEISLIREYDLPLNLKGNTGHPFYSTLKKLRKESKKLSLKMIHNK
jgi:hypothetical protein